MITLLTNFNLIDGTGRDPIEHAVIAIQDGEITAYNVLRKDELPKELLAEKMLRIG